MQFCNKYMVAPSQKNSFWAFKKWKMNFPCKENDNSLRQHCLEFQDAPLCTIWGHLNKLCHECGHKIDYLAWKPWIFTHDSSFLRTLSKHNYHITSFFIFPGNFATYNDTTRSFSNVLIFFGIFHAHCKMRSKRRASSFLASGWIFKNFWGFYD